MEHSAAIFGPAWEWDPTILATPVTSRVGILTCNNTQICALFTTDSVRNREDLPYDITATGMTQEEYLYNPTVF